MDIYNMVEQFLDIQFLRSNQSEFFEMTVPPFFELINVPKSA
ncbi:hypothetical protein KIS4809_3386 [Bacillus sp. ZZV12-4809]|nr:hypothetical protein KIS4809_3386 [Bacillus sp. ZZV12-4809]